MANETLSTLRNKIAILIDGDNAQSSLLSQMLVEAGRHGQITVRRIGKNATDSAMIIDAMDILHAGVVDGFCLVSSDSDYTRLATRIREKGVFVMGIGEKKTPKAFVNACDLFVYTENLVAERKTVQQKQSQTKRVGKKKDEKEEPDPMPILSQAFEMAVGQDGWAPLAGMGQALYQLDPGFDPRTYGHKQLSRMIANLKDRFEMRTQNAEGANVLYVKMKE
jgi:hypothetical protein